MTWWAWLVVGWVLVACLAGLVLGRGLRTAERQEWVRRGRPDRRERPRAPHTDDVEPNVVLQPNIVAPAPAWDDDTATPQASPAARQK
jgi:hypothetical protein